MASGSTSCRGRPDPERFARLALAPARVARVFSDPASKTIQAVVDEDQLSLAIGRNGQNVRLASELTGWKIDLYSSREWLERGGEGPLFAPLPLAEEDVASQVPLTEIEGLSPELVAVLNGGRLPAPERRPGPRARRRAQGARHDARSWRTSCMAFLVGPDGRGGGGGRRRRR